VWALELLNTESLLGKVDAWCFFAAGRKQAAAGVFFTRGFYRQLCCCQVTSGEHFLCCVWLVEVVSLLVERGGFGDMHTHLSLAPLCLRIGACVCNMRK